MPSATRKGAVNQAVKANDKSPPRAGRDSTPIPYVRLTRLDVNDKIKTPKKDSVNSTSRGQTTPPKKASEKKTVEIPTKSTRASKRQHVSDSGNDSEQVPRTRARGNNDAAKSDTNNKTDRQTKTSKKNNDQEDSDVDMVVKNERASRSSKASVNDSVVENKTKSSQAKSARSNRSSQQKEDTDSSSIECDESESDDDIMIVENSRSQTPGKQNTRQQANEEEESVDSSSDEEEVVQVRPRGRATRSQARRASYEEISDSQSEDDEDITEISDDDDDEISFKGSPKPARKSGSTESPGSPQPLLADALNELTSTLARLKEQYEAKLKKKDEEIGRLKNDLKYKDDQLEDMQTLAQKNIEMEAKISLIMSSKEAYEEEVKQVQKEKKKEQEMHQEDNVKSKTKEKESRKDGDSKSATKRSAVKTDDSDIEIIEDNSEDEKPPKAKSRRKQKSGDETAEEDDDDQKKPTRTRRQRGKKASKEEKEEDPDTLFVSDDSEVEDEKTKKKDKKADDKNKEKETEDNKTDSDGEEDIKSPGRHNIRKIMGGKKITQETKIAAQEEKERRKRLEDLKAKHYKVEEKDPKTKTMICKKLVLEFKENKDKTPIVEVPPKLIKKLKPHQVEAVEFMWDCLIESTGRLKEGYEGSGCILAHCMGLGKTLSVITVLQTMMTSSKTSKKFRRALVVCPLNTVLNWQSECKKWIDKRDRPPVYELVSSRNNHDRCEQMRDWHREGGIMIMGYQLFRILVNLNTKSKKRKQIIDTSLLDPGPDVVVCDEGHMLKNDASAISKAMNRIKTKRRIILTGTPLQNNLVEYHCMVSFVKPSLLGTRREFGNRFINPITNGQHADSTQRDVKVMKRRAHVLHEMLAGCVQRKDYSVITKWLPVKHEYVISVRLSKLQMEMYEKYLQQNVTHDPDNPNKVISKGASLFADYQVLMRVWTHPWVLKLYEEREEKKLLSALMVEERRMIKQEAKETNDQTEIDIKEEVTEKNEETEKATNGYTESDDDELESLMEVSSESDAGGTTTASSAESEDEDETTSTPRRSSRRSLRSGKSEDDSDKDEPKKEKKKDSDNSKNKDVKSTKGKRDNSVPKGNTKDKSEKKEDTEEETESSGKRKAKVVAGEVIKNWQSVSRGNKADEGELNRKKEESWWASMVPEELKMKIELSGKLTLLFEILRMAESVGDKVLVFSQSILSLDLIENFLAYKTEEAEKPEKKKSPRKGGASATAHSKWIRDEDYYRMDGSTGAERRKQCTNDFNNIKNEKLRLFLISTKAGGLGINLDRANRVIIFDASWNPSHDIQSIFRVYRFGQVKPVYVYRFLAQGTMEEKIYERQIMKEALSERVVDEHQLDRHFNAADVQELYRFKPERLDDPETKNKPTPKVPEDVVLAELLSTQKDWIVGYHEHDSLLEKRPEENLSEEERKAAWEEYEREKKGLMYGYGGYQMQPLMMSNLPMTHAPIQMPRNEPFTSYLRLPQPQPSVPVPVLQRAFPGTSSSSVPLRVNYQSTQLPRVIQEILKYNPTIRPEELQHRLNAFMGMQNKAQNAVVPGFALSNGESEVSKTLGPDGKPTFLIKVKPGAPQIAGTSSQPGGPMAGMMGLVPGLPVAQPMVPTIRPTILPKPVNTPGIVTIVPPNLPSRLPQPGVVPAANK